MRRKSKGGKRMEEKCEKLKRRESKRRGGRGVEGGKSWKGGGVG